MNTIGQLYRQYDPWVKHPDLFSGSLHGESVGITLRPFFIPEDFHFYNEWLNHDADSPGNLSSAFSENYFLAVLESSNAQSLWGLIDGEPAFGLELYKAVQYHAPDEIKNLRLQSGDVMMQIVIAPWIMNDNKLSEYVLPACLKYIFTYSGTERLLLVLDRDSLVYIRLARQAKPFHSYVSEDKKVIYEYREALSPEGFFRK